MPSKNSSKVNDFTGQDFFIGLDVHKKSWSVTVRAFNLEVEHFNAPPNAALLAHHLRNRYQGAIFHSAYEAGFCGTSIHEALCRAGIDNIVIHAADLPQTDKHRKNKTDLHDSRAIACYLEAGLVKGIHIMPVDQQELRSLFRYREKVVRDAARSINRLKGFLHHHGVILPAPFQKATYINRNYLKWLSELDMLTPSGTLVLHHLVEEVQHQRSRLLIATRELRSAMQQCHPQELALLGSIPGIGPITAMALLAEIGDFARFASPKEYTSYLGLIPCEHSSGETLFNSKVQPRCNRHLRPLLVEAAWAAIRHSVDLLAYYKKHVADNDKSAILKVARKLALICKGVVFHQIPYQPNYCVAQGG